MIDLVSVRDYEQIISQTFSKYTEVLTRRFPEYMWIAESIKSLTPNEYIALLDRYQFHGWASFGEFEYSSVPCLISKTDSDSFCFKRSFIFESKTSIWFQADTELMLTCEMVLSAQQFKSVDEFLQQLREELK